MKYAILYVLFFCFPLFLTAQEDKKEATEDKTDYWQRALEKLKAGSYGEAAIALDKFIDKNKNNALAYQKRGFAKRKMGNADGAEADYTQALAYNANLVEAYLGRAQVRTKLGIYTRAIEDYDQILTRQPTHSKSKEIFYNRGLAYLKMQKYKEAMKDFREVLKIERDYAQALVNIGFIYYFSGEIRKACLEWLRASDLKNDYAKKNAKRACQCCM